MCEEQGPTRTWIRMAGPWLWCPMGMGFKKSIILLQWASATGIVLFIYLFNFCFCTSWGQTHDLKPGICPGPDGPCLSVQPPSVRTTSP